MRRRRHGGDVFREKTEEAVEYFQGSKGMGLEVNGMIDTETWLALLGKEKFEWGPAPGRF